MTSRHIINALSIAIQTLIFGIFLLSISAIVLLLGETIQ